MRRTGKVLIVGERFDLFNDNVIADSARDFWFFGRRKFWCKRQFVGDHRVVCPLLVVFTNRNGFFGNRLQQRNEERSLKFTGKCLDGRYENIFLDGLSPRGGLNLAVEPFTRAPDRSES